LNGKRVDFQLHMGQLILFRGYLLLRGLLDLSELNKLFTEEASQPRG